MRFLLLRLHLKQVSQVSTPYYKRNILRTLDAENFAPQAKLSIIHKFKKVLMQHISELEVDRKYIWYFETDQEKTTQTGIPIGVVDTKFQINALY